jgi:hypothetical protein
MMTRARRIFREGQKTMSTSYSSLIKFPALQGDAGSLSEMEKSILGHFILLVRPRVLAELGVFKAVTTSFICDFMQANGIEGTVVGFETPETVAQLRAENRNIKQLEAESRLRLIPGWMPGSLSDWLNQSTEEIDLALVDATHNYRSVSGELNLLWKKLSPDGYILCHDYSSKYDGVRYAVDHFAKKNDAMVLSLAPSPRGWQAGHGSVLVALRRRPFDFSYDDWRHHLWLKAKADLLEHRVINRVWSNWVKPIVKGRGAVPAASLRRAR